MNSAVCSVCFCLFNILFVLYFDRVVGCVMYMCVCVWSLGRGRRMRVHPFCGYLTREYCTETARRRNNDVTRARRSGFHTM